MTKVTAAITAVAGYVPEYVLTNKELEKFVNTTSEWIESRTGIKERRILKGEGLGTSDMCAPAVELLLKKRGIKASEIDLIIVATVTPDYSFPSTSNLICDKLELKMPGVLTLQAAVRDLYLLLQLAHNLLKQGNTKK